MSDIVTKLSNTIKLQEKERQEIIQSNLALLENNEVALIYGCDASEVKQLEKDRAYIFMSLMNQDYPYTNKNDIVSIVNKGKVYTIRTDLLKSYDDTGELVIKDQNHLEEMLPSMFLHKEKKKENASFLEEQLGAIEQILLKANNSTPELTSTDKMQQQTEADLAEIKQALEDKGISITEENQAKDMCKEASGEKKPKKSKKKTSSHSPKSTEGAFDTYPADFDIEDCLPVASQANSSDKPQEAEENPLSTTPVFELSMDDYSYNVFDVKIVDASTGEVLLSDLAVYTYLLFEEDGVKRFVTVTEQISAKGHYYRQVFTAIDKPEITVSVKNQSKDVTSYDIEIGYDEITVKDKDYRVVYQNDEVEANDCAPSWSGIYAFPFSPVSGVKGGVLVAKKNGEWTHYRTDSKDGYTEFSTTDSNGVPVKVKMLLKVIDNKLIGERVCG